MAEEILAQALAHKSAGRLEAAAKLASNILEDDRNHVAALTMRAEIRNEQRRYDEAVGDLDVLLIDNPQSAAALYRRAVANFCRGSIQAANKDFESYLELRPEDRPYRWEYGISLYYAGRFQEGADLFGSHQTVNSNDVENAAWRYLCMARADNVDKARRELIPIQGDSRVPMRQIHELYRGKLQPSDVLAAAQQGELTDARRKMQLFYAHLYIGLYYEANGEAKLAEKHLREADQRQISHYMWDVAHVHVAQLGAKKPEDQTP